MKKRVRDKYGRGSAAANGEGFVDLAPSDTFSGVEAKLRLVQMVVYENPVLGITATIASHRNANELAKHMSFGEWEEAHKFAAKNVGALLVRGKVGIRHFDKKAIRDDVPKPVILRVFSPFCFANELMIATITLRAEREENKLYAIEAVEINKDTDSERTPRGETAPLQNPVSYLACRISYYVGDVNRTCPMFVASAETFSIEAAAKKIVQMVDDVGDVRKTDLSVIILQKNEKLHIRRCLEKLAPLAPRQVFVVDCFSTDGSDKIASEMGATVVYHEWPGDQATQFNWVLDNLTIEANWILRLDADEYLYPETIDELRGLVTDGGLPPSVTSLSLSRARHIFGGEIRHGKEIEIVRVFRRGCAHYAQTEMDEHLVVDYGQNYTMKGRFVDYSLMPFAEWRAKHRDYAKREAQMAVSGRCNANKRLYYKLPRYLRALMYFSLRYFVQLGFLDGLPGWRWNFWQGLWYRWIVDQEIGRMKDLVKEEGK